MSAYYKVDNRILTEAEYEAERNWVWGFWLFILGAGVCGHFIYEHIPADWIKEVRFGALISGSILCGSLLAYVAAYVRRLFYLGIGIGVLAWVGFWVWSLV